ncbi:MAG: hypothetical protein OEW99_05580 [Gammaproteobacteria bacterium]|nr:hypothetical protein [Gammaproteobacteria bacterium]
MKQALLLLQRRLFFVALVCFSLTPVIGYATASFFNMIEINNLFTGKSSLILLSMSVYYFGEPFILNFF